MKSNNITEKLRGRTAEWEHWLEETGRDFDMYTPNEKQFLIEAFLRRGNEPKAVRMRIGI